MDNNIVIFIIIDLGVNGPFVRLESGIFTGSPDFAHYYIFFNMIGTIWSLGFYAGKTSSH